MKTTQLNRKTSLIEFRRKLFVIWLFFKEFLEIHFCIKFAFHVKIYSLRKSQLPTRNYLHLMISDDKTLDCAFDCPIRRLMGFSLNFVFRILGRFFAKYSIMGIHRGSLGYYFFSLDNIILANRNLGFETFTLAREFQQLSWY